MHIVFLILGLLLLFIGAECLIRSASSMAVAAGISPLVVGLTVVAYGTSTPEMIVSLQTAIGGQADLALGNVVGSNIFNVLFILGLAAMIIPLRVTQQLIWREVPLLVVISGLSLVLGLNGWLSRLESLGLLLGLVLYTFWLIVLSRREHKQVRDEYTESLAGKTGRFLSSSFTLQALGIVVGLALLIGGSRWFTGSSIDIARALGVSDLVIGLTIVAGGTSLPEVATSVLAAMRGERDIAVGNVVGSNIFNLLGVLGVSGLFAPGGIPVSQTVLSFDLPVMIVVAVACLPVFFTDHLIARWEGGLFLLYYVAYTVCLIAAETGFYPARSLSVVGFGFVAPLFLCTLFIWLARRYRSQHRHGTK